MADLFKKLNVLVKASLNELLSSERTESASRTSLSPDRLGGDIDRQLAAMRQRVDDAKAYENKLQAQINTLDQEIKLLDQQADQAVERGDEVNARFAIADLRTAERRQMKLMNDFREHQIAAQELIDRVDQMTAMVVQAREQAQTAPTDASNPETSSTLPKLADVLRRAQEAVSGETIQAKEPESNPDPQPSAVQDADGLPDGKLDGQPINDDLERRRQRLSKKD